MTNLIEFPISQELFWLNEYADENKAGKLIEFPPQAYAKTLEDEFNARF